MKSISMLRAGAVSSAVLLAACGDGNVSGPEKASSFLAVQQILTADCGSCHDALSGRFFLVSMDSAALQRSGLVDPTAPENSLIIVKPLSTSTHGGGLIATYTADRQRMVSEWISRLEPPQPSVVEAIKVGAGTSVAAPGIDGFYDPVWDRASRIRLRVADGWGDAEFVTVQAAYDATYLYMVVV